jgi:hypothetical protein
VRMRFSLFNMANVPPCKRRPARSSAREANARAAAKAARSLQQSSGQIANAPGCRFKRRYNIGRGESPM